MAGNSYLDGLWNKVKQYAPTQQVDTGYLSALGHNIYAGAHAAAGHLVNGLLHPIATAEATPGAVAHYARSVNTLATGAGEQLDHILGLPASGNNLGQEGSPAQREQARQAFMQTVQNYKQNYGSLHGFAEHLKNNPYQVAGDALMVAGPALSVAGKVGELGKFARGVPEELTTGTDIVPSKGPVTTDGGPAKGDFATPRDAAQYMADNKLGGSHDIVAHGDGSYSAVPREGTLSTPADVPETPQSASETPQAPPVEAEAPSATQPTPEPQEAPQPPSDEQQQATELTTAEPTAPLAPDGLPGNGSVRPIDPAMMARIMNDPGAIGQGPITTPAEDSAPVAPSITTSEVAPAPAPQQIPQGYEPPVPAPVPNAGAFQEVSTTPDGTKTIHYTASNGETIPIKMGIEPDGTAEMAIDQFGSRVNQFGPSEIRQAMKGLMEQYPEIKRFGGFRRSGAGAGRVQEITPSSPANSDTPPVDHGIDPNTPDFMKQQIIAARLDASAPKPVVDNTGYETHTPNVGEPKLPANDTTRTDAAKNFVKNIASDERGSLGYKETPDDPKASDGDPVVQKMTDALNDMAPLRKETSKQISQERSDRIAQAMKAMHANEGEEALHGALGALKGDMPKAIIPSIRDQFTPEEVTHLFNLVKNSNRVSGYEKINTMRALQKVLGEHYGEVPTEGELKLLSQVFPKDLINAIQSHSLLEKVAGHATNILGIPRAVKTIGDLGVAFRQCSPLIGTKEFWKSFPSMFKGIASENLYHATFEAIKQMDSYPQMVEGKVAFTNMDSKLTEREEFAASKIAEHIPGVRQSERGFTGYLNTVRALTFDRLYKKAVESGANVDDPEVLKEIGNFVNILSGRGSIGEIGDKASPFLAAAFFSPRLQWSRLQLLTMPFNPKFYRMPGYLQKEYLRSVISYGLYMGVALGVLQHVFGAKVNNDPRSTDYGRAVIGKTRFDVSGSFQPYVRTVAQVATGQKVTATGKTEDLGKSFGVPTRLDTVVSFAESKASPNVDVILNELRGKDWEHPKSITGQEMDWKDHSMNNPAVDALIPMGIEAMMKAGDVYGYKSPLPYVAGAAETGGITANTYADQKAHGHHGFKGFGSGSGFKSSFKGFK